MRLADNAFNPTLHGRAGFEVMADLVERSACLDFAYGRLEDAMNVFERLAGGA